MTQGALWLHLWSHARFDLGVSESEFWKLTRRQLSALTKRFKIRQEREELLTGLLCAVNANFSMRGPTDAADAYCAADFVPGRKKQAGVLEPETDEELALTFAAAFAPFVVGQ